MKKQANVFQHPTGSLLGGAVGASAGLAIYPYTSAAKDKSRWKRIKAAAHLLLAGGVVGSGIGALTEGIIAKNKSGVSIAKKKPETTDGRKRLYSRDLMVPPRPYPGDKEVRALATPHLFQNRGLTNLEQEGLLRRLIAIYGEDKAGKAAEIIHQYAERYMQNYKNKAIEIPQ